MRDNLGNHVTNRNMSLNLFSTDSIRESMNPLGNLVSRMPTTVPFAPGVAPTYAPPKASKRYLTDEEINTLIDEGYSDEEIQSAEDELLAEETELQKQPAQPVTKPIENAYVNETGGVFGGVGSSIENVVG